MRTSSHARPVDIRWQSMTADLRAGAQRLHFMVGEIRPDEPGASDRLERIAWHCDGLRRQVLLLGASIEGTREP